MKVKLQYNKIKKIFIVKLNNKILFNYYLRKISNKNNYSFINYNYNILLKILRIFGLIKPIYNFNDYKKK